MVLWGKMGEGWCDVAHKKLFTFGGSYICANFGENPSKNVTECPDGYTDRLMQTGIIICPMLYAIATAQIKKMSDSGVNVKLPKIHQNLITSRVCHNIRPPSYINF